MTHLLQFANMHIAHTCAAYGFIHILDGVPGVARINRKITIHFLHP